MNGLDLTTIIISAITLITLLVNVIYKGIKEAQAKDSNNDKKQWETIDKLITGLLDKQEQMCKTLTKLFQRVKKMEQNNSK